jgi:hypothetical protein
MFIIWTFVKFCETADRTLIIIFIGHCSSQDLLLAELPKLQADVDFLKVNQISTADVMAEADALYKKWPSLPLDDRRKIAEAMCEKIVIGHGEIDITYSHLPSSEELCKNQTRL